MLRRRLRQCVTNAYIGLGPMGYRETQDKFAVFSLIATDAQLLSSSSCLIIYTLIMSPD